MKKGQVEDTFHWVFVIIAGAVILLVFGVFIFNISSIADKERVADFLNDFNLVLAGGEISQKTVNEIESVSSLPLEFSCTEVSAGGTHLRLSNRVVFGPPSVQGSRIILWSYDWSVPFFVTNFLYVSGPGQRYVFVSDSSVASRNLLTLVEDVFPEQFTSDFVTVDGLDDVFFEGHDRTTFVFLEVDPVAIDTSFSGNAVDILRIGSMITYYDDNLQETSESGYIGDASLFGAIVSGRKDEYDCLMERALLRMSLVAQVYEKRVDLLGHSLVGECLGYSTTRAGSIRRLSSSSFGLVDFTTLNSHIKLLEEQNEVLQGFSCPLIY